MASTLYRCSKCGDLFNAVFGSGSQQKCRACKTGDKLASTPGVKFAGDIKIVEPVDQFIRQPRKTKLQQLNDLTQKVFDRNPSLGQFVLEDLGEGIPVFSIPAGMTLRIIGQGVPGSVFANRNSQAVTGRRMNDGKIYLSDPVSRVDMLTGEVDVVTILDGGMLGMSYVMNPLSEPQPEPVAEKSPDPHEAMLNPKRKLRIQQ